MYKSWGLIGRCYIRSSQSLSIYDCYDLLVSAVQYVLDKQVWTDSNSSIYNDEKAIEKAICQYMSSRRCTYYQAMNRYKRKDGFRVFSLDELAEKYSDGVKVRDDLIVRDKYNFILTDYIKLLYKNKKYFTAYMVDNIINSNVFKTIEPEDEPPREEFSKKRLASRLNELDDKYCIDFAYRYNMDTNDVKKKL